MSSNFFLDGNYTTKQIEAINKIKSQEQNGNTETVAGDASTIFSEINSYAKDKTSDKNSDLFNYIEKNIGMSNFMDMLDADGDGKISEDEAKKIASYDNNADLTSADIDAFAKDIKGVTSAKTTKGKDEKSTETTYEADSTGKLVKKSAKVTNNKENKELAEYTYNADGTVKQKINKVKNTITNYEYKDGKKTSKVYTNDANKILKAENTYGSNGKVESKKEYISPGTGVRVKKFRTFEYDENGKLSGSKVYKGDNASGSPVAEYSYSYEDGKLTTRTNNKTGSTKNYVYDENGKLTKAVFKNKDGKEVATNEYNEDGTYKNRTTSDYVYLYDYATGGIRSKATKYKKSDIGEDGKPKDKASAVSTTTYKNGLKTEVTANDTVTTYTYDDNYDVKKTTVKDKKGNEKEVYTYENGKVKSKEDKSKNTKTEYTYDENGNKTKEVVTNTKTKDTETTTYDENGKITAKTKTTSEYVYIYSYKDGKQTGVKKYKASDCVDGKPKDGAKAVG